MTTPAVELGMEKKLKDSSQEQDPSSRHLMHEFGPNIYYVDGPHVNFYGFDYPTRMVVVKLSSDGGAWMWSSTKYSDELGAEIEAKCGAVRHIVSPNCIHHIFLEQWSDQYPQAKVYAPPGLSERKVVENITFDSILTDDPEGDYAKDVDQVIIRGSPMDEVVFYHRASETVVFGDLIQRFDPESCKGVKGWLMRLDGLVGVEGSTPREWRFGFWWYGQQELARKAVNKVLEEWKPKKLLIAHGMCAKEDATEIVRKALSWIPETKK